MIMELQLAFTFYMEFSIQNGLNSRERERESGTSRLSPLTWLVITNRQHHLFISAAATTGASTRGVLSVILGLLALMIHTKAVYPGKDSELTTPRTPPGLGSSELE